MRSFAFALMGTLLCVGCVKSVSRKELLDYIANPENGLIQTIDSGPYQISAVYRPTDLLIEQEIRDQVISSNKLDSIKSNYSKFIYFLLRLSCSNKELVYCLANDPVRLNQIMEYLSFKIGSDVYLLSGEDTLNTKDFIQTRTFGSGKSTDMLFAFEITPEQKENDLKFVWDDSILGVGKNELEFQHSDIVSIPNLMLNKN